MPLPENGFTPGYGPGYGIEYGYGYGYGNGNGPRPSASTNTRITGTTMTMTTEEAWRRDQIAAARFFDRAKVLEPAIEAQVPKLPSVESVLAGQGQGWDGYGSYGQWEGGEDGYGEEDEEELEMPCIELNTGGVGLGVGLGTETMRRRRSRARRRGQGQGQSKANEAQNRSGISAKGSKVQEQEGAVDGTWYILNMIPGLVGAGTALVVVGVVGVLSFSSWSRRNHGS
ncbi:hypothetical protein D9758_003666 [Tetrapyrgos nigripes]|uniref:Transmembrane protein n=1 Tax=Tetrapyrgos nigripes TaxID=182062 RepID=A0A8H5GM28_9AGAR|nr:hypothetical protein D9758_003666 [Tetrapyrgos nigripes]